MSGENWVFFQAFLKAPTVVASVIPSSTWLKRRVVEQAGISGARTVVELGPGTGGLTETILEALGSGGRVIAIERTEAFVANLHRISDPRFEVVHGCASTIREQLDRRGIAAVDAVVSGIPFSTMPADLSAGIAEAIGTALGPGGRFVAYQFTDRVADYTRPVLGDPCVDRVIRNVPPMRVFTWEKDGGAIAMHNGARFGA